MTGPVLIIGAGVWVLCQVFGGNALKRLGIISGGAEDAVADASAAEAAAKSRDAVTQLYDPTKPGTDTTAIPGSLTDALGRRGP